MNPVTAGILGGLAGGFGYMQDLEREQRKSRADMAKMEAKTALAKEARIHTHALRLEGLDHKQGLTLERDATKQDATLSRDESLSRLDREDSKTAHRRSLEELAIEYGLEKSTIGVRSDALLNSFIKQNEFKRENRINPVQQGRDDLVAVFGEEEGERMFRQQLEVQTGTGAGQFTQAQVLKSRRNIDSSFKEWYAMASESDRLQFPKVEWARQNMPTDFEVAGFGDAGYADADAGGGAAVAGTKRIHPERMTDLLAGYQKAVANGEGERFLAVIEGDIPAGEFQFLLGEIARVDARGVYRGGGLLDEPVEEIPRTRYNIEGHEPLYRLPAHHRLLFPN